MSIVDMTKVDGVPLQSFASGTLYLPIFVPEGAIGVRINGVYRPFQPPRAKYHGFFKTVGKTKAERA